MHAEHLNRPIMMTVGSKAVVWQAVYKPFGEVYSITGPGDYGDSAFKSQAGHGVQVQFGIETA